jgi:hypothetical protein
VDVLLRWFRNARWELEAGCPPKCPEHARHRPAPPPVPEIKMKGVDTMAAKPSTPTVREPTMKEMRLISVKLDGVFDADKGMFLDGYSDAKVASELDLPLALVVRVREEAFGKLMLDPDLLALRDEFNALQTMMADMETTFQRRHADLTAKAEDIQRKLRAKGL